MLFFKRKCCFFIMLCVFISACSYKFAGGGALPGGIGSVSMSILKNRTSEIGVENIITNDLIYEFSRNKKVRSQNDADAILSGIVKSVRIGTISRKGQNESLERRVEVAVDLELTNRDGNIIWFVKGISEDEAYTVASDKLKTEQNKREAISVLSKRLAERIYNRLTDDF